MLINGNANEVETKALQSLQKIIMKKEMVMSFLMCPLVDMHYITKSTDIKKYVGNTKLLVEHLVDCKNEIVCAEYEKSGEYNVSVYSTPNSSIVVVIKRSINISPDAPIHHFNALRAEPISFV